MSRLFVPLLIATSCVAQTGAPRDGSWPNIGGDAGHAKYSPLEQINPSTVADLAIAWTWISPDAAIQEANANNPTVASATYFQCTPIYIDSQLYVTTCLGQASAIDGATGETKWVYNPDSWKAGRPPNLGYISRGAAYWADGTDARIYYATGDSWLHCLDANTGKPIDTFADHGRADLLAGVPRATRGRVYGHPSAPIVVADRVIVGSAISDGPQVKEGIPGVVKAFDARTGAPAWEFHIIPLPGEFGADTWRDRANEYTGNANVWTNISADLERGLVYLPTSTPTNDFYGGHRLGDGLFAESLVCLDAKTGERVWHYQFVHHGLWDYDLPCAPNLVDLSIGGKMVPAVAQVTKQGFTFVFNRVTGEPIFPIEERPVPQSAVPGEETSPTQPFPLKPPPFARQGVTEDDLIDYTPELRAKAREILRAYDFGPLFTPASLDGPTLMMPGYGGGANWPGAALDPETATLYVPAMNWPSIIMVGEPDRARSNFRYNRALPRGNAPLGTNWMDGPDGLPLLKGPYAALVAIDLNVGEIRWEIANGGKGPIDHRALKDLHLEYLGTNARAAVLVTKTLIVLTEGSGRSGSATGGNPFLRFLDKRDGHEIHRVQLPGDPTGVPMTYQLAGKQYIAIALGTDPAQIACLALR